nr:transposase [Neisseria meningitidis]
MQTLSRCWKGYRRYDRLCRQRLRQCGNRQHLKNISCWTALCAKPAATARCRKCKPNATDICRRPVYVVEQSFGTLHRKFRYARAAYFGLIKVSAQSHLKAMCLNLLKAANRLSAPAAA